MAHRSVSQMNTYERCPRQWYYRYVKKLPEKNSHFFTIGTAFDDAMSLIIENGSFSNEAPIASDDLIEEGLGLLFEKKTQLLGEADFDEETKDEVDEKVFHLSKLIKPYFNEILPSQGMYPLKTQRKINYYLEDMEDPILGYIDMIAYDYRIDQQVIVDFKTANSVSPSLDYKRQVWVYAKAIQELDDLPYLPRAEIHMFSKGTPTLPKAKRVSMDLENEKIHRYPPELIEELYSGEFIRKKCTLHNADMRKEDWLTINETYFDLEYSRKHNFFPKNRTHSLCSERFCSFWKTCHSEEESQESLKSMKSQVLNYNQPMEIQATVPFMVEPVKPPPECEDSSASIYDFLS